MEGFIKGMKESHKALNQFLDEKVNRDYPEYITRQELNTFLNTYVKNWEDHFKATPSNTP